MLIERYNKLHGRGLITHEKLAEELDVHTITLRRWRKKDFVGIKQSYLAKIHEIVWKIETAYDLNRSL